MKVLRTLDSGVRREGPWVVAPVVALREGVVRASNAPGHEFVPADELARTCADWEGRPLCDDHPNEAGIPRRASTGDAIGFTRKPRMSGQALVMEAWVDTRLAPKALVDRVMAGEMLDVSVGVLVDVDGMRGLSADGRDYQGRWSNLLPDHLALLPAGKPGACSVAMGCGLPRAAAAGANLLRFAWPNADGDDDHGRGPGGNAGDSAGQNKNREPKAQTQEGAGPKAMPGSLYGRALKPAEASTAAEDASSLADGINGHYLASALHMDAAHAHGVDSKNGKYHLGRSSEHHAAGRAMAKKYLSKAAAEKTAAAVGGKVKFNPGKYSADRKTFKAPHYTIEGAGPKKKRNAAFGGLFRSLWPDSEGNDDHGREEAGSVKAHAFAADLHRKAAELHSQSVEDPSKHAAAAAATEAAHAATVANGPLKDQFGVATNVHDLARDYTEKAGKATYDRSYSHFASKMHEAAARGHEKMALTKARASKTPAQMMHEATLSVVDLHAARGKGPRKPGHNRVASEGGMLKRLLSLLSEVAGVEYEDQEERHLWPNADGDDDHGRGDGGGDDFQLDDAPTGKGSFDAKAVKVHNIDDAAGFLPEGWTGKVVDKDGGMQHFVNGETVTKGEFLTKALADRRARHEKSFSKFDKFAAQLKKEVKKKRNAANGEDREACGGMDMPMTAGGYAVDGTDDQVRSSLHDELYKSVPAFGGVLAVSSEEGWVVYRADGKDQRRSFETREGGTVAFVSEPEEVRKVEGWVTAGEGRMLAEAVNTGLFEVEQDEFRAAAEGCGCGGKNSSAPAADKGQEAGMKKKEIIARILAAKGTPYVEADRPTLEAMAEDRLTALAGYVEEKEKPAEKKKEPDTEEEDGKGEMPEALKEKFMAACPDIRAIVEEHRAKESTERAGLVAGLKALGAFGEEELTAMPMDQLRKTARVAAAAKPKTDFSVLGAPRAAGEARETVAPPPSVAERIAANRAAK